VKRSKTKENFNYPAGVVIFGQNGQVGSDLISLFANKPNFIIYSYSSKDIDFTNTSQLQIKLKNLPPVSFIINASSYNEVDRAEEEQETVDLINHIAVKEIAKYCRQEEIKFIHYSTNYVFDGLGNKAYAEDNIDNLYPLSTYGKSKLDGEKSVINSKCDYLILRLATVFNLNKDNNFVAKIKKLSQSNSELKIVDDQITNPTSSFDIAGATIDIIEQIIAKEEFISNIYHLASNSQISYYKFAQEIIKKLDKRVKIIPVTTDYFPTKAKRPLNGALDIGKIRNDFNINIPLDTVS
jgi:dTDP-4-dehydrorhamnose reductase